MVRSVDQVDKAILLALNSNCRTSYQSLAKKLDLTVNAIKKRINKLLELGVIQRFYVYLSLAMLDAEMAVAILSTDGSVTGEAFLDKIGANPMVHSVSYLSDGSLLVFAEYVGAKGQSELLRFLRQLKGVTDVELHTIIVERGRKYEFTKSDVKVLQCLVEDARMPIAEIARQTRLTPKRIRKTLKTFLGEGGSVPEYSIRKQSIGDLRTAQACVHFRLWWDLNAGGGLCFIIRIGWDEGKAEYYEIVDWVEKEFPEAFWYAYASASAPAIFSVFIIDHIRDAEPILNHLRKGPHITSVRAIYGYPAKKYPGLRQIRLEEILKEAA